MDVRSLRLRVLSQGRLTAEYMIRNAPSCSLFLCVLLSAELLASGCTYHLATRYWPSGGICAAQGHQVTVTEVADRRPEQSRIGVVKSGYGMEVFDAKYLGHVSEWARGALISELSAAGLDVRMRAAPQRGVPKIAMHLRQVFVEPKVGLLKWELHALVLFELFMEFPDGRVYQRVAKGHHMSHELFTSEADYDRVLLAAAHQAFGEAASSVCKLLLREER